VTQPPDRLAHVLLTSADRDGDGRISFEELEAVILKHPELLWKMTRNEAMWIAPNEDLLAWLEDKRVGRAEREGAWLEHGWAPRVFTAVFFAVNVALFVHAMARAAPNHANLTMLVGRAFGKCLDFCGALILLPMMRGLVTRVRATWLSRILPVDEAVSFHRIIGHTMWALGIAHSGAAVFAYVQGHGPRFLQLLEARRGLTGVLLLGVLGVMWFFSLHFIRRSKKFELFYFTHLLYLAWLGLAIAHAPSLLPWFGVPLLGFLIEQALRLRRRGPAVSVVGSEALRSGVARLEIARPPGFTFDPGDYAFLRIPSIARHEWHPFTISSAPERANLTFHVRALGNWTTELRRRAEVEPNQAGLVAYIDGPYGSPSAHIFESRFAVLIGAGIGVTPFASVLESLVLRANAGASAGGRPVKLEKAHFFWANRDQYSFEWFVALLAELERVDERALLDVHLCMTGARAGAMELGVEMAREMMQESGVTDLITGLRTHTHLGAPDWEEMLSAIAKKHAPAQVDVFFCGPPGLGAKLRPICERLVMTFREEKF
jgi:predicted ferric reductase